jgi:phenylacetate-CoA ligase
VREGPTLLRVMHFSRWLSSTMNLENAYAWLPVSLQNMAVSLAGRKIRRLRFNGEFFRILAEYEGRSFASFEVVKAFREARIREFIAHAAQTTPHYRDLFAKLRIDPREIRGLAELAALPILTKAEVQAAPERFLSEAMTNGGKVSIHTSGSTGAGLKFSATRRANREHWAVWYRYYRWHGISFDMPCLHFGGRSVVPIGQSKPPYWRYNRALNQTLFSAYHLSDATARDYLRAMRDSGAQWIHGYPSFVALAAAYAVQLKIRLNARFVTLSSENVLPQQESIIREAFGVLPIQHYGMAEGVANASMCPARKLHIDEDFAAWEFVESADGIVSIIGTNFTNPAFPLIRYSVGDTASFDSAAVCDCGRPGRIVSTIDGRQEDYVVTSKGVRIGRLDHVFKDMVNVREAQLVQDQPGRMTVRIVKGPAYMENDERMLRAEMTARVGGDMTFDIVYVDAIERTSRGKLRFVISTFASGKIAAQQSAS